MSMKEDTSKMTLDEKMLYVCFLIESTPHLAIYKGVIYTSIILSEIEMMKLCR